MESVMSSSETCLLLKNICGQSSRPRLKRGIIGPTLSFPRTDGLPGMKRFSTGSPRKMCLVDHFRLPGYRPNYPILEQDLSFIMLQQKLWFRTHADGSSHFLLVHAFGQWCPVPIIFRHTIKITYYHFCASN